MRFLLFIIFFNSFSVVEAQSFFSDSSLKNLLTHSDSGIIFVWSPQMPLSQLGREEILQIGHELGLEIKTLLDPFAHSNATADDLLKSTVLMEKGVLNHFPGIVLYKNHQLLPWMLQGYEEKESLKKLIIEKLEL